MATQQPHDLEFTTELLAEAGGVAWNCVIVPGAAEALGTRRAAKVSGTVDGEPFSSSLMPMGDGRHMLPIKAALRSAIGKQPGDRITVRLDQRLS
jgi:hypothetical protein